jgi:hypothetical protein
VFRNAFCYRESRQKYEESFDSDSGDNDDGNSDLNKADEVVVKEEDMINLANSFLAGEYHDTELIIEAAAFHVMHTKSM